MDIPAFGFRPEIMNGSGIGGIDGNAWMRRDCNETFLTEFAKGHGK